MMTQAEEDEYVRSTSDECAYAVHALIVEHLGDTEAPVVVVALVRVANAVVLATCPQEHQPSVVRDLQRILAGDTRRHDA